MNNIEKVTTVISNMIDECLLNGVYMCKPNENIVNFIFFILFLNAKWEIQDHQIDYMDIQQWMT